MTAENTNSESPATESKGEVNSKKERKPKTTTSATTKTSSPTTTEAMYDHSPKTEAEMEAASKESARAAKKSGRLKTKKEKPEKAKPSKAKPKAKEEPEAEEQPSYGQGGSRLKLDKEELNEKEAKVLASLRRAKNAVPLADLAERTFPKSIGKAKGNSWTRNSLRRLVRARLVKKVGRGEYIAVVAKAA